jgi:hypothetical protein
MFSPPVFSSDLIEETEADNLYLVRNIETHSKSVTASKAKEEALRQGQKTALKVILKRADINPDYTKYVSDAILAEMIESIQIKNEIMTKDSYSSFITVLFNKKFLNFHLKRLNIGVGKVANDVFLYIPLAEVGGKYFPDGGANPWYRAAYENFFENAYENIYLIDNYDMANSALLNENMIKQKNYNLFFTLLRKYSANVVIISTTSYNSADDSVDVFYAEIDGDKTTEKKLSYRNTDGLPRESFLRTASVKFLQMLDRETKIRAARNKNDVKNLEKLLRDNSLDLYIVVQNLRDYAYLKNLILSLDFVRKHETAEFTTKLAVLRIYYRESEEEIISMFNHHGFEIKNRDGKYFITYRDLE